MNSRQRQQGDVTIEYVKQIPAGARRVVPSSRGYVIAEGEATGHAHVLDAGEGLEVYERDGVLYARIVTPAALTHEEHHTQTLTPGIVRFGRVQEYDHFAEEARTIAD